jgi:hypothetical protein
MSDIEYSVDSSVTVPTPGELDALMVERLLQSVRAGPNFVALVTIFATRAKNLASLTDAVLSAFDLETAVGVQLDTLGVILQRPRLGHSDDRYRILLQIQVQLILSSTGTPAVLIEVVRLFTGVTPAVYTEHHPLRIEISAQVSSDDTPELLGILREVKMGGVALTLHTHDADALTLDYHPGDTVDNAGIIDYHPGDTVNDAGTLTYQENI